MIIKNIHRTVHNATIDAMLAMKKIFQPVSLILLVVAFWSFVLKAVGTSSIYNIDFVRENYSLVETVINQNRTIFIVGFILMFIAFGGIEDKDGNPVDIRQYKK
ncbi:hypothetical protein CAL7716_058040 [Calothrix sp. PCC 7716]|nr:hypothetical protein CAL7716_058040 [Calothrix sp. PCC 7716]